MDPRLIAITLVVLLASLTACSDDEPAPTVTPTPTASSSPTPTKTEATAEPESGDEFVRRWFELYVSLQASGNGGAFRELAQSCDACDAIADRFESIYDNGGWIRGGEVTVTSAKRVGPAGEAETWLAEISVTPTRYKENRTSEIQRLDGGEDVVRFQLEAKPDRLVVTDVFQESR